MSLDSIDFVLKGPQNRLYSIQHRKGHRGQMRNYASAIHSNPDDRQAAQIAVFSV